MKRPAPRPTDDCGFTLLEMLIVLAVVGALAAMTVPALREPLAKSRLRDAARQVRLELLRARTEAIKSGTAQQFRLQPDGRTSQTVSAPILFYPNGRATNARIRLLGQRGFHVDVTLRGLTGSVTIGPLLREEGRP